MIYSRQRIRILVETTKAGDFVDASTQERPHLWRGVDVQFEIAFTFNGVLIDDLTNLGTLTMEVHPATNRVGTTLMAHALAQSEITSGITQADWDAGIAQHAIFPFTYSETALDLGGQSKLDFWCVLHANTNDPTPRRITFGGSLISIEEDGAPGGEVPPNPLSNYSTTSECDGRYISKAEPNARVRWVNGGEEWWDFGTLAWRPVSLRNGLFEVK